MQGYQKGTPENGGEDRPSKDWLFRNWKALSEFSIDHRLNLNDLRAQLPGFPEELYYSLDWNDDGYVTEWDIAEETEPSDLRGIPEATGGADIPADVIRIAEQIYKFKNFLSTDGIYISLGEFKNHFNGLPVVEDPDSQYHQQSIYSVIQKITNNGVVPGSVRISQLEEILGLTELEGDPDWWIVENWNN